MLHICSSLLSFALSCKVICDLRDVWIFPNGDLKMNNHSVFKCESGAIYVATENTGVVSITRY